MRTDSRAPSCGPSRRALWLSPKTVETHIRGAFAKLGINAAPEDNRRVLAVLAYLRR